MGVRIISASNGLAEAVERLRSGELVAFPTETVYGLGADARSAEAVARIFLAKGRPSTNPVIVHVSDIEGAKQLTTLWTTDARNLADAFWPGPLTMVLPRTDAVPDIVTAGGPTVGLRIPNHPVALELLRQSGVPIAAPSANRSEEVSPTTAQHVADSLGPYVDDLLILDGGPCTVGIESTVIDLVSRVPRILRPGMVTEPQLRKVLGELDSTGVVHSIARAPGQMLRHYSPRTPAFLIDTVSQRDIIRPGDGILNFGNNLYDIDDGISMITLSERPEEYAATLYSALRTLDESGVSRILIVLPPSGDEWMAIHDRLRRAETQKETNI